jgi:hypothetical protein
MGTLVSVFVPNPFAFKPRQQADMPMMVGMQHMGDVSGTDQRR